MFGYFAHRFPSFHDIKKIVDHGPAVQIDVKRPGSDSLWFSIDIAMSFEVAEEKFIPHPKFRQKGEFVWRQSHFKEEQILLCNISDFPKSMNRTMKAIRDGDMKLKNMNVNSYLLKTTLLNCSGKLIGSFAECFLRFLTELYSCFASRNLPHHHVRLNNLLIKHDRSVLMDNVEQIAYRLRELIENPEELRQMLDV